MFEAYERLVYDAMVGDRTLFSTATGIRAALAGVDAPPRRSAPVETYPVGSWDPESVHDLIAPHGWRMPFGRR